MKTVYVMQAEHFSVPGLVVSVHESDLGARRAAADVVRTIRDDHVRAHGEEDCPQINGNDFEDCIAFLEDYHGAARCYAVITPTTLQA